MVEVSKADSCFMLLRGHHILSIFDQARKPAKVKVVMFHNTSIVFISIEACCTVKTPFSVSCIHYLTSHYPFGRN